ncbi:outer membrane protein [Alcanivorax hongdengensis]|uniref:outer membrane protein n=1 Tax=Alcanivorax hongdengensis TaxID=519051 RepID=UPI003522A35D
MNNYDPGAADGVSLAAGYFVTPNFRAELSLDYGLASEDTDRISYTRGSTVQGTVSASAYSRTLMVNGYFHFRDTRGAGQLDPYVGAGLGLGVNHFEDVSTQIPTTSATVDDSDDIDWAFRVGGGVMVWLARRCSADLSIFYLDPGSVTTADRAYKEGVTVPFAEGLELNLASFTYSLAMLYRF